MSCILEEVSLFFALQTNTSKLKKYTIMCGSEVSLHACVLKTNDIGVLRLMLSFTILTVEDMWTENVYI